MSKYGYARVSTKEQNEDRQIAALLKEKIRMEDIFVDKQSGKDFDREMYKKLLRKLKKNDVLYIKSIDRLGRNYEEIGKQWKLLTKNKNVDIVIIDMPILDTRREKNLLGTLISDIIFALLSYVAENERNNIRQRQAEGIMAAKARGVKFGRPKKKLPKNFKKAVEKWENKEMTAKEAAEMCGMPYSSFRKEVSKCKKC